MILEKLAQVTPLGVLTDHADRLSWEADTQNPNQVWVTQTSQDSCLVFEVGPGQGFQFIKGPFK